MATEGVAALAVIEAIGRIRGCIAEIGPIARENQECALRARELKEAAVNAERD